MQSLLTCKSKTRKVFPYRKTKLFRQVKYHVKQIIHCSNIKRDLFSTDFQCHCSEWWIDVWTVATTTTRFNPKTLKRYSLAGLLVCYPILCTKKSWLFQLLQNQMWFFLLSNEKSPFNCITRHEKRLKMKPKWSLKWRRRATPLCAKKHQHRLEMNPWKQ